jgi:hypothetical protein
MVWLSLLAQIALAQAVTGTLLGTVLDSTGAAVPNATVTLRPCFDPLETHAINSGRIDCDQNDVGGGSAGDALSRCARNGARSQCPKTATAI